MKRVKLLLFFILLFSFSVYSQTHWVVFTDKNETVFNPYEYFDEKAIERRLDIGYDLHDYSDFPVNEQYVLQVENSVDSVSYVSRWMNALSVWGTHQQLAQVSNFEFVKEIIPIEQDFVLCSAKSPISKIDTSIWTNQLSVMQGNLFAEAGIDGRGVRVAVFDGGFPGVDTHPAFEHIRNDGRIIKTWDFVRKREHVYGANSHGTMVLSVIAGIYNGKPLGLATGAEFLLARTERNTEPYSEEVNWAAALEWADKNGADIVNSSLGYTYHRYFPYQMDGQTSFISRIANQAASKGILIVNAAGNDGDNKWTIIGAPADADSILSVGGINPYTDYRINFSSFGPTSDFRRKPNVCAFGHAVVAGKKNLTEIFGTSFASPLVAGFAACTKQLHPELHGVELKEMIEQSGRQYPFFDYAHGYGVPQASKVFNPYVNNNEITFFVNHNEQGAYINISDNQLVETSDEAKNVYNNYLYFAYIDNEGIICEWGIIKVTEREFLVQNPLRFPMAVELSLHFRGYTTSVSLTSDNY